MNNELSSRTLSELAAGLSRGEFTSREIVESALEAIRSRDAGIRAFLEVSGENVLREADESDARRRAGRARSEWDGIPVGIKDNIAVRGERLSCASKLLEPVKSPYDATAVVNLRRKGFIPFGRLNMDEFAMGSSCENSAFQRTANPHDMERVPGGSSGGSAAAVAAGLVPVSLGSDTGGSIRQPAAFCGVVGMKPTYGRVSRYGLVAFASSLDQIGPFGSTVEDAAALLMATAGADPMDCTCLPDPCDDYVAAAREGAAAPSLAGLRVGLPEEYFATGVSPDVQKVLDHAVSRVRELGGRPVKVSLPHTRYAVAVYYIVATAEASANLARFDGVRYGARKEGRDLVDGYFKSRGAGFGSEVKRRILLGTYVLSSGYYDAYYLRAQKVRTLIRGDFSAAFNDCDVMLAPVTPTVAFRFGEKSDPLQMYLSDIFTIALNLAGGCGLSLPAGTGDGGMPVGVQLMAPELGEARLLKTAAALEAALKR